MNEKETIPGTMATGSQPGLSNPERTFTKEQVNNLMQKRVERSHQAFFNRYGVKDLTELDALLGKSKSYDQLKQEHDELNTKYGDLDNQFKDLTKRYAYKVGNINNDKINDIETYFKGKQLDINEQNLMKELKTHPDWVNQVQTIEHVGVEGTPAPTVDEAVTASAIFGVDLTN